MFGSSSALLGDIAFCGVENKGFKIRKTKGPSYNSVKTKQKIIIWTGGLDWHWIATASAHLERHILGLLQPVPQRMAPFAGASSPAHTLTKRRLPHVSFIGIAVGVGVFLVILISIALWCYIRGWRLPGRGPSRLDSDIESSPTRPRNSARASTYWNADDIGKSVEAQVTEIRDPEPTRESRIVMLPTPSASALGFYSKHRESPIVRLPTPSLISWRGDVKDGKDVKEVKDQTPAPQAPTSGRLPVFSRHVSMQLVGISQGSSNTTLDRTPVLEDFPSPGGQWSKVTDLRWQSYQR